jgi:GxxExxY protein
MLERLEARFESVRPEQPLTIRYGSEKRVRFRPDFIVEDKVVVEIKARSRILRGHWAQVMCYLKATGIEVGILLNFGPNPTLKRFVLTRGQRSLNRSSASADS